MTPTRSLLDWLFALEAHNPQAYAELMDFFDHPGFGEVQLTARDGAITYAKVTRGHQLSSRKERPTG